MFSDTLTCGDEGDVPNGTNVAYAADMSDPGAIAYHAWLGRQLSRQGRSWADLARAADIPPSLLGKWGRGDVAPTVPKVRATVKALGDAYYPARFLPSLVTADILVPEEVKPNHGGPTLSAATDHQLFTELWDRTHGRGRELWTPPSR